jgi:hypothetical protein
MTLALSSVGSAPGTLLGTGGMCARGPQAVPKTKASPAAANALRDKSNGLIVLED